MHHINLSEGPRTIRGPALQSSSGNRDNFNAAQRCPRYLRATITGDWRCVRYEISPRAIVLHLTVVTDLLRRKMSLMAPNCLDSERSARQLCGVKQPRVL